MTSLLVVDTEFTGLGSEAQAVEVAVVRVTSVQSFLVKPTVPVEPAARAVHHLRDEDLAAAPTMQELLELCPRLFTADVFVAHNAEFDRRMLI